MILKSSKASILEYIIISSLLKQEIGLEDVESKWLSPLGQRVVKAVEALSQKEQGWDSNGVILYLIQVLQLDEAVIRTYFSAMEQYDSKNTKDIWTLLKERSALLQASNEIQTQLLSGNIDLTKIQGALDSTGKQDKLTSASDLLAEGEPAPPSGPPLVSLPRLSEITNGVFGIYLIGGVPAIGKTTLAQQVCVDLNRSVPTVHYDLENPPTVPLYRLVKTFGLDTARQITKNLYIRDSLRSLQQDLKIIKPPACLVIDSIQKAAGTGDKDKTQARIGSWMRRFEHLKKQGYSIVIVSEVPREYYENEPSMAMFKYSGDLEYAADTAIALTPQEAGVQVHVVKNRHYEFFGRWGSLIRKDFWFKEL